MPATPPLSVTFTLTRADLLRLNFRAVFRNPVIVVIYLLTAAMWVISMLAQPSIRERSVAYKIDFGTIAWAVVTVPFCVVMGLLIVAIVFLRNHRGVLGPHTITLSDEGLLEKTEFNEGRWNWSGILRVQTSNDFIFAFVNDSLVHLIPKRAFASPAAALEFETRLRKGVADAAKPLTT